MKRFREIPNDQTKPTNPQNCTCSRVVERRCFSDQITTLGILAVLLIGISSMFAVLSSLLKDPSINGLWTISEARHLDASPPRIEVDLGNTVKMEIDVGLPQGKLFGGLLPSGLDEKSCLSRYQSALYHKKRTPKPSQHLISGIRKYEAMHKQCGPNTEAYNKTLEHLKSAGQNAINSPAADCKYVVWISFSGLGNRILTLASAFLYALLTNRVLLVDPGFDIPDLFCEPFPEMSWLLPSDFPFVDQFDKFDQKSPESYGNLLKMNNVLSNSSNGSLIPVPPYVYLHLVHDYNDHDKLFFCDQDQTFLQKVPWLILKSNIYFVPSLFLIPSFQEELNHLFPAKGAVFHLLSRYLLHPSNSVWGLITRYYDAYLAKADERIGIQIRVFNPNPGPFRHVLDQVLDCVTKENLLPRINENEPTNNVNPSEKPKTKAILMTSLSSGYYEAVRNMYWKHSTATGEVIQVFQPSHEKYQQTEKKMHNRKAWAEMYLLSMTDKLVTSSWSTFGYVAQSLGGLKPWILYKPENQTAPNPPCRRAVSMEPCFHAPPFYDCKASRGVDTGKIVPHVRHCEDMSWGLKLVDKDDM